MQAYCYRLSSSNLVTDAAVVLPCKQFSHLWLLQTLIDFVMHILTILILNQCRTQYYSRRTKEASIFASFN